MTLFFVLTKSSPFRDGARRLAYSWQGQQALDEIAGGTPYGATTITGGQGERMPSDNELDGARFQGRLVAETAMKLHG